MENNQQDDNKLHAENTFSDLSEIESGNENEKEPKIQKHL